ncbi:dTMP kinase [Psychrobacter sp. I-STPA6b]|uniref:dTMP kinase n=1 Tax=Psychrobacter sp. I-STPA6b TaxID=2585718 RepID=UPI001D0C21F2|nr:dTMP kinase [Psychrobacter sp. I-STPA6b]
MHARFISFEGTEGVGKTTAINQLCQRLQAQGIDFVRTREPGGSDFAEQLRTLLLAPETQISDDTELLLMFAARCDHLQQVILPALDAGKWVICDRFIDSSMAYQGFGRGCGDALVLDKVQGLIQQFVSRLPDITIWLDLPVIEGIERAAKRSVADRFEQEAVAFFSRVHQGYAYQHQQDPKRVQRVDASGDVDEVAQRVWQVISHNCEL